MDAAIKECNLFEVTGLEDVTQLRKWAFQHTAGPFYRLDYSKPPVAHNQQPFESLHNYLTKQGIVYKSRQTSVPPSHRSDTVPFNSNIDTLMVETLV